MDQLFEMKVDVSYSWVTIALAMLHSVGMDEEGCEKFYGMKASYFP